MYPGEIYQSAMVHGTWHTVYDRFNKWSKDGTITSVLECLQIELNELGLIDWSLFEVDSTSVRAHKSAEEQLKKGLSNNQSQALGGPEGV